MTFSFVAGLLVIWIVLVAGLGVSGALFIAKAQSRRRRA
jgi:hypothetical protein